MGDSQTKVQWVLIGLCVLALFYTGYQTQSLNSRITRLEQTTQKRLAVLKKSSDKKKAIQAARQPDGRRPANKAPRRPERAKSKGAKGPRRPANVPPPTLEQIKERADERREQKLTVLLEQAEKQLNITGDDLSFVQEMLMAFSDDRRERLIDARSGKINLSPEQLAQETKEAKVLLHEDLTAVIGEDSSLKILKWMAAQQQK